MRVAARSDVWVALMRGINVGGNNMLPRRELVGMFEAAGCDEVRTYVQSGNVVFRASAEVAEGLAGGIPKAVEGRLGFRPPLVMRSAAEMRRVARGNPFLGAGVPEELLHVYFLDRAPRAADVAGLDARRSAPDVFEVIGREIYLRLEAGMARTKLTNAYFDGRLGTVCTARNWRTVSALVGLVDGYTPTRGVKS